MSGIQNVPFRVPEVWSAKWFYDFVRTYLAPADVRNAVGADGIVIITEPSTTTTIMLAGDTLNAAIPSQAFGHRPAPLPPIESQLQAVLSFTPPQPPPRSAESMLSTVFSFLPPPTPERRVDDLAQVVATQVFARR